MKDPADAFTGDVLLGQMQEFARRARAAQRAVDELGAGKPPKPKRGVSKNAAKSASRPERGER